MARTLGLDIGTNSIGWALLEDEKQIIGSGVRIFPVGVKSDDFLKLGKEVSKNVARRMARSARRRRFRYKLRREKLLAILKQYGMLPDGDDFLTTRELYELRSTGLDQELSLHEFGRILLLLNKRRGFKSNRKTTASEEAKKEEGKVKQGTIQLQKEIEADNCRTVGEYFALLFRKTEATENWHNPDEPIERIRNRWVGREMYEHEFELLWQSQLRFHRDILDVTHKELTPEGRVRWEGPLKDAIGIRTIYHQRPLKSQKGLVGRCRFEPSKRCAPKSSALFQEFRIWQQLSGVRFGNGERIGQALTSDEKRVACAALMQTNKMTEAGLKKLLGFSRSVSFNDVFDLRGNSTNARLIEALGKSTFDSLNDEQLFELWHLLSYADDSASLKSIALRKIAEGKLPQMSEEVLDSLAETSLEEGYGNFSTKAIKKFLPFLREGLIPFDAFTKAGYDPTKRYGLRGSDELMKIPPLLPNELRNPIVQQMLGETFRVINAIVREYGKPDMIRVELARELKKPKDRREQDRHRSKDKRHQREDFAEFLSRKLKRRIEPNSPEIRKYELWLEMGCEDEELDKLDAFLKNGRITDAKKYHLWKECNRISPYSGKTISLTKLFSSEIEIEHIVPYSKCMNNEFTNLSLCESNINKDKGRQLPYEYFSTKGINDLEDFKKRIVVFKGIKRNRFLMRNTDLSEDFLNSQLNNTSYAARELASRLEMLLPPLRHQEKLKPRIQVVNGQATSLLRKQWQLNAILSKGDIDTKNRGDHRHHAIDAIVIACTSPALIHTMSSYSTFDALDRFENKHLKTPWRAFLQDADSSLNSLIVSYRNEKRLIGKKPNKIKVKNLIKYPDGFIKVSSVTVRGPLHEETIYGSVQINEVENYVSRRPLSWFTNPKQLEKVVDPMVRKVLLTRVKKFQGDIKKAFSGIDENPIWMHTKTAKEVPIKKVRMIDPAENFIQLRPAENERLFAKSGNNYLIAIYEDPETGRREFEVVSFWEATQRALKVRSVIIPERNGKPLLFSLVQKDIVVLYEKHADEIDWNDPNYLRHNIFRVRKFDVNGNIYLDYLYVSDIDEKEDRNRLFFSFTPNTLRCVKVEVDLLGRIVRRGKG